MRKYKKETDGTLEIGQILYTKRFMLTVDRTLCKGCELCKLICPREAITLISQDSADGKARACRIDIDENKCDFHGICAVICPFDAITITINGSEELPAVEKEVFPALTRDIAINTEKCENGCDICAKTCPLGIISVNSVEGKTAAAVRTEKCAACTLCWIECPSDAIDVTKFIEGSISIDSASCPEGCRNCMDVCPVNAIALSEDGKAFPKDIFCIYCGACLPVCPKEGAIKIERTAVRHSPVTSGAWHKGLEKITSPQGLARELAAERTYKTKTAAEELTGS